MAKWEGQSPALRVISARKGKSSFGEKYFLYYNEIIKGAPAKSNKINI
jgi:hypothetical protein